MLVLKEKRNIWLLLLGLVLSSNLMLYYTTFGQSIVIEGSQAVVLGSLLDLVIVAPLLWMAYKKQFTWKQAILLGAGGLIAARFLIPIQHLEPFVAFTWVGFAIEGTIIALELFLVISLVLYLPKITSEVKKSPTPTVFAFPQSVDRYVNKNPIVHIICTEMLMLYYAFGSWNKQPRQGITMYKNSNYLATQMMIIHAIVLESVGFHWFLHKESAVLSIVLLVLNAYTVFFFLGDIQAMRLNPTYVEDGTLYLSMGLMKRVKIPLTSVVRVVENAEEMKILRKKGTVEFMASDMNTPEPDFIILLSQPVKVKYYLGFSKKYQQIAVRCDDPKGMRELLEVTK
ncbi:beta-carotene 15,15'-monooxygenase [Mangrovibacillus cuniculi]|uniref:Beta-carotene 15,15'-monooxygenase n=1 Tax=Mangrovibacillus cuniculi TaxID=2593652 RepID=A0A7S8C992_9BACI|nr:beta-carotene 15,15'-monooxygenase [Mangrovibacillus cuniculi]QPC45626.1 beta-carotene 15,15'-monooxygenase [Mangrovibacillus cuniculi]